jgi:autotransporter-associated beta strand protein
MTKSTKTIIIAAALTMLATFPANSASIEEFQTEEYYASNLDLINAAEAYAKGYTGKGITIGINDFPVNLEHESFADKTGSKYIGSLNLEGIDWKENSHGTHVSGIAVGSKNGKGMHGVAFDADLVSTYFLCESHDFPKFDSYSEIKTINNSWGNKYSIDDFYLLYTSILDKDNISSEVVLNYLNSFNDDYKSITAIKEAASKDRLLVCSNGNYGRDDAGSYRSIHWFNNKSINNLITVTAMLNSYSESEHLKRNSDGSITGDFINAPFSNLTKYCEDFTLTAPGWNIYSSYAADKKDYIFASGTSMAAPFVTGGAALVQQAFPYMNSKQIGDVLLSTANFNINITHPFNVIASWEYRYDENNNPIIDDEGYSLTNSYAKIFYLDERTQITKEEIERDLKSYCLSIINDNIEGGSCAYTIFEAIQQGNISVYYQTPIQEFVGQGVLDVGKAVSGPGALNARRLEKANVSSKYLTDGQNTVMYDIDTKGYDSCWDNDIKEIRVGKLADNNTEEDLKERYNYYNLNWISNEDANNWQKATTKYYVEEFNDRVDKSGLEGLHVGLLKSGKGVLKLNGNNTYQGPTVVTDGSIAINGSVAGDAYSENDGIIMGKGKINGTLYNNNIAIAGDNGVGNLTMGGLESKGKLVSVLNNGDNTKFVVDGKAKIDGSTVVVAGLLPGESCTVLKADSITGELANSQGNTAGTTAFLKEYAKIENNEVKYVYDLNPNFAGVTAKQAKAFDAIKRMYLKLISEYNGESASSKKNSSKENLQISRHPSVRHSSDTSPQVEALEDINSDNSNEAQSISRGSYRAATTPQQMAQILTFINLPAAQAGPALNAVINNAAAQSMTLVQRNSMTGDILSSHFADRFCSNTGEDALKPSLEGGNKRQATGGCCASERQDGKRVVEGDLTRVNSDSKKQTSAQGNRDWIATQSSTARNDDNDSGVSNTLSLNKISTNSVTTPTCQRQATSPQGEALENGAWFKFVYNKGEMRDGARYRGRSGIIGYDLKLTDTKSFGLFFGHGNNTLDGFEDTWAKNKIEENKFGIYASRKSDKASGFLYFDYGKVDNELNRTLTNLNLSTNVKYKGDLFEIGGEYKLTPKNQKNKTWKVYPYVNLQFSRYKQDGYHENGGGIFNQVVQSKTNNYAAGQLGLEFNFSNEKENYVLRLAGKSAFSGEDPKPEFSFEGDMGNRYELDNDQDKNHLLVSFKGERKISTDTLLSAEFSMQRGSHDRDMKASLSFWKRF